MRLIFLILILPAAHAEDKVETGTVLASVNATFQ